MPKGQAPFYFWASTPITNHAVCTCNARLADCPTTQRSAVRCAADSLPSMRSIVCVCCPRLPRCQTVCCSHCRQLLPHRHSAIKHVRMRAACTCVAMWSRKLMQLHHSQPALCRVLQLCLQKKRSCSQASFVPHEVAKHDGICICCTFASIATADTASTVTSGSPQQRQSSSSSMTEQQLFLKSINHSCIIPHGNALQVEAAYPASSALLQNPAAGP